VADAPSAFGCKRLYQVPQLADAAQFLPRFLAILAQEQPDLILPGRDDDVVFLARFREQYPQWAPAIPCGAVRPAEIARDKWLSFQWARSQGLSFADSALPAEPGFAAWVESVGYPLIAKPRKGSGSLGVYLVDGPEVLESLLSLPDLVFQEYLSPLPDLSQRLAQYRLAPPLFFEFPDHALYTAHGLILPDGQPGPSLLTLSRSHYGLSQDCVRLEDAALQAVWQAYAEALARNGWRGFVSLECKPDANSQWQVHEMMLRSSGGTALRFQLGFDEVGELLQAFFSDWQAAAPTAPAALARQAYRMPTAYSVSRADMALLQQNGFWQRNPDGSA
jgi:carbamoyl-phosphate synthase large subunit